VRCDVKEGSQSTHMQAEGAAVCLFRFKHVGLSSHYHNHVLFQLLQGTMDFCRIVQWYVGMCAGGYFKLLFYTSTC
jgi:hypothetical protein